MTAATIDPPPLEGTFRCVRTADGAPACEVNLDTDLGHLGAVIPVSGTLGELLEHMTQGQVIAAPAAYGAVGNRADAIASELAQAARTRGTSPDVLAMAVLFMRARLGDQRAQAQIHGIQQGAAGGDPYLVRQGRMLGTAREFARQVLGVEMTGSVFSHLGHSLANATRSLGRDMHQAEHVLGPVIRQIKRWGPLILSDVQGLVSMIPGIGTGISAAISTAEAILKGGGPLSIALHAAYGAIPIPPGIRPITDVVLDTVIEFIKNPKHFLDVGIAVVRDRLPPGLPQEVFDTLVKVVVKKQPLLKSAIGLATHAIGGYTQGLGPNVAVGLHKFVPDEIAAHLSKLPDPSVSFRSIHQIAPHFEVNPHDAHLLLEHAQRASGVTLAPEHAAQLAANIAAASAAHATASAQARVAQRAHDAPHIDAGAPAAALAVQVSPDGSQARMQATPALADAAKQTNPSAVLAAS